MADVILINTSAAKQAVDLTDRLEMLIQKAKLQEEGLCILFVTHTTAALMTGEIGERCYSNWTATASARST